MARQYLTLMIQDSLDLSKLSEASVDVIEDYHEVNPVTFQSLLPDGVWSFQGDESDVQNVLG